jgi:hypothetical protein
MDAQTPNPSPGVVKLPGESPLVHPSIKQSVDSFLTTIEPGTKTVMLNLDTQKGGNLALAIRDESGHFGVKFWVGKSGWDAPLKVDGHAGIQIAGSW